MGKAQYLVVDDREDIREFVSEVFADEAKVYTACDGAEAFEILSKANFDAIICDVQMPHLNGMELYEKLKKKNADHLVKFLFCTGNMTNEFHQFCQTYNIPYCRKPISVESLKVAVRQLTND